jgi:CheY-like chemotaxis protein
MKVLLVEDYEDSRDVLRAMLEKLGYEVGEATNGRDAVEMAIDYKPDIVLMDLSMPGVDGLQSIAAIRAISQFPRQLLIVAMTAFPEILSQEQAFKAGCDAYLQKPFGLEELSSAFKSGLPKDG